MLWFLPIEPLEERYTAQWYEWFPEEFKRQGVEFLQIGGQTLTDRVEVGTFLDINSTIHYKADQIQWLARYFHGKKIKDGDVIFLADAEMFGLEAAIAYMAKLNNVDVKICAFAHAGSYTKGDFVVPCHDWAANCELSWGVIFDKIFVGSTYHKHRLMAMRQIKENRILALGNPFDVEGVRGQFPTRIEKKKRVIHTNRPDPEKNPDNMLDLFEAMKDEHEDWEFMVTTSRPRWSRGPLRRSALKMQEDGTLRIKEGLSKEEYYRLLAESAVMTGSTVDENFGYCVLESLVFNTIPVVVNNFSHPEILEGDERCLYTPNDGADQLKKIEEAMDNPFNVESKAAKYQNSLENIVEHLS